MMRRKLLMLVSMLCLLAGLAGHASAELIAYWPFDEGTGTVAADVIGGNDGQITGCTWLLPGIIGDAAIDGAGNDRIDCGNGPTPTTDDLTISWWMIDNQPSYGRIMYKADSGGTTGYSVLVRGEGEGGRLRFRIGDEGDYGGWGGECRIPDEAYNDGEWVHITCTYDSETDTAAIYVNGVLAEGANNPKTSAAAHTGSDGINAPDAPLYIRGGSETFTGTIDEVAIWDTALTAEEVMDVYENGANPFDYVPSPADGSPVVGEAAMEMSWLNVDPNVVVDVYWSTDPCDVGDPCNPEFGPVYETVEVTSETGEAVRSSVTADTTVETTYYWRVITRLTDHPDVNDIIGPMWTYTSSSDIPPTVVMHSDPKMTWSGYANPVDTTVVNLGPTLTEIAWTHDAGPTTLVEFDPITADTEDTIVTITKLSYEYALIPDAGFEDSVYADGESAWTVPTGWTGDAIGIWNPGLAGTGWPGFGGDAFEGENVLFVNNGGVASTVLVEKIEEGVTYTLSVDVGLNIDYGTNAAYNIQLLAGAGEDAAIVAEDANDLVIALGAYETSTISFTCDPVADADKVGLPLQIKLQCTSTDFPNTDVEFDNVVLTTDTLFPPLSGVETVTLTISVNDEGDDTVNTATLQLDVYDSACHLAREAFDADNLSDLDKDCDIDIDDLASIAATWLNDTSLDGPAVSPDQADSPLVINGDFETIYEPGTTSPCTIGDGDYFGIGGQQMKGEGVATYADGSTGTGIELPGWTPVDGTNSDVMQAGTWGGIDDSMALLVFAGWGGPTTVETAAPLSIPVSGPGGEYELSAMINHPGRPIVLELLVDGVVVTPETSNIPDESADWTEMSNTYSSIPVGDVTVLVGTRDDSGGGWTGSRASIDNVTLTVVVDANLPSVDAGENMITWTDEAVALSSTVTAGLIPIVEGSLSYLWTAYPNDGVVFSDPVDSEDPNTSAALAPTVTITKDAGDVASVKLMLSVTLDGQSFVNDFITIDVYDNACLASVAADPELNYDLGDINKDCTTNLDDFALLAAAWLVDYSSTGPLDRPEEE